MLHVSSHPKEHRSHRVEGITGCTHAFIIMGPVLSEPLITQWTSSTCKPQLWVLSHLNERGMVLGSGASMMGNDYPAVRTRYMRRLPGSSKHERKRKQGVLSGAKRLNNSELLRLY